MHQIHCDRFLSNYFGFTLSVSLYQRSTLIFIHMLLLPEQMGEARDPSKKQRSFGNLETMPKKYFQLSNSASKGIRCDVARVQYAVYNTIRHTSNTQYIT